MNLILFLKYNFLVSIQLKKVLPCPLHGLEHALLTTDEIVHFGFLSVSNSGALQRHNACDHTSQITWETLHLVLAVSRFGR